MEKTRPVILWDVDGTLVDSEPLHEAALVSALAEVGLRPSDDFHQHVIGRDAKEVHGWCQEHLGLELALQDWLSLKYRTYLAKAADLRSREGAVALFKRLREDGYSQGIVSNSDRIVVNANLEAVGLIVPGQVVVTRNDVRDGKPKAEPYLRGAWLFHIDPGDCVVVEDSLTGARAGIEAGMRTLFWPQSELPTPEGAVRIDDLADLERKIREGLAS